MGAKKAEESNVAREQLPKTSPDYSSLSSFDPFTPMGFCIFESIFWMHTPHELS